MTGPLPFAGDGVSEPDECRLDGMPSNRGISSDVTTSTTIASGGGACKALASTRNEPTVRAARWAITETTSPGRIYRFNPFIRVQVDVAPPTASSATTSCNAGRCRSASTAQRHRPTIFSSQVVWNSPAAAHLNRCPENDRTESTRLDERRTGRKGHSGRTVARHGQDCCPDCPDPQISNYQHR